MTLEEAKQTIIDWLTSVEPIDSEWRIILSMCLKLIDEKLNINNNEE